MGDYTKEEYASKGVAGTGLGLGIAGTALGLLNNNGNGLGGLFGGNNNQLQQQVTSLTGEVARLNAEKYSDNNSKQVYMQTLNDNNKLRDEMFAFVKPLSDEAANNRVELAKLQAELKCCCEKQELREQIVLGKVNEVALATKSNFDLLNQTINCLSNTVAQNTNAIGAITKTVVPKDVICPEVMPRYNSFVVPTTTTQTPAA